MGAAAQKVNQNLPNLGDALVLIKDHDIVRLGGSLL